MNRLTLLVNPHNSPASHRLFTPTSTFSLHRVHNTFTSKPFRQLSTHHNNGLFAASLVLGGRRESKSLWLAMDLHSSESEPVSGEDFVHIESPSVELLSESIVRVDHPGEDATPVSNVAEGSERNNNLPEELSRNVVKLTCDSSAESGVCDVYLIGTAHVSEESCREVEAIISHLKPEAVFLELCSSRMAVLTPQKLKVPTVGEMVEMWRKKQNAFAILYSWFLAKVAYKLEVFPGSEFRVAYEEAMKYGGRVILGDRPVQITLKRTWAKMPLWHKIKLVYTSFFQTVFLPSPEDLHRMLKEMDDVDMLTLVIQDMSKQFPTLMETLVHERDQYMSSTLHKIASEHATVVAVVGKGHLQGIRKNWLQPVVVKDLMEIPQKPAVSAGAILKSVGVAVAGVAIISGIYFASKR